MVYDGINYFSAGRGAILAFGLQTDSQRTLQVYHDVHAKVDVSWKGNILNLDSRIQEVRYTEGAITRHGAVHAFSKVYLDWSL